MKQKKNDDIQRIDSKADIGLSNEEVQRRREEGLTNEHKDHISKSYGRILSENIFNVFNIVLFSIVGLFIFFVIYLSLTGRKDLADSYFGISKFFFILPVIFNAVIGTIQEIRSKRLLQKLKIVSQDKASVIREGKEVQVANPDIVLDDIVLLKAGQQASVDILILEGRCQVDEALLTGEADPVEKKPGDIIYAGSLVMTGSIRGRADKVGAKTYSAALSEKVRAVSNHKSELMGSIYGIIHVMALVLIGVAVLVVLTMVYKVHRWGADPSVWSDDGSLTFALNDAATWAKIIITLGTYSIGIIPTGLVVLTSVTLAISIVRLAKQKTMIQELYSLENLSRADTLCLDKTGTLTDGTLKVVKLIPYLPEEEVRVYLRQMVGSHGDHNATDLALMEAFGQEKTALKDTIPFSSERKYAGIIYPDDTEVILGAPDYLLEKDSDCQKEAVEQAKTGNRVLALMRNGQPIALLVLEDIICTSAKDTIDWFIDNHVDIRVISGDSVETVKRIAATCHVPNAEKAVSLQYVSKDDIPALAKDNVVFARVSPEQKSLLVEALQAQGRKVAMTGDGVNDILAMRKANASISFAKATEAAKNCAEVVLLDNDFSHLKEVVGQGRRVVNNIQRTAILFLMKTIAIASLAVLLTPFKRGQMWFSIENLYMMQTSVTAIGGFLFSLEGTKEPIRGTFRQNVYPQAVLAAMTLLLAVFLPIMIHVISFNAGGRAIIDRQNVSSLISIMATLAGISVAIGLSRPMNGYRWSVVGGIVLVAALLGFGSPTSYIGGQATTFQMLHSPDGHIFHSPFFRQFFQPWNAPCVVHIYRELPAYLCMTGFIVIIVPLYFFLSSLLKKKNGDILARHKD